LIGVLVAGLLGGMVFYLFCRKPLNKQVEVKAKTNTSSDDMVEFDKP
jgi:hypothetical protein